MLLSDVDFARDGVKRATIDGKEWTVVVRGKVGVVLMAGRGV